MPRTRAGGRGRAVTGPGKRTDVLIRTRGRIGALCFVEIKFHEFGSPVSAEAFLMRPRSVVVCGDPKQFRTDAGVNQERLAGFELFRRQLASPDVVTFDELLKARSHDSRGSRVEAQPQLGSPTVAVARQ